MNYYWLHQLLRVMVMAVLFIWPPGLLSGLAETAYVSAATNAPWEGNGSKENPYKISNVQELFAFNERWEEFQEEKEEQGEEVYFELTADIVVDDVYKDKWQPIGDDTNPFKGTINGNGHKIKNLIIDRSGLNNVGLFGYVEGGTIQNVGLEDVDVYGKENVGILVGYIKGGTITNAYAKGNVEGGTRVGGLVGYNESGTVEYTYATGDVKGVHADSVAVGGLVGMSHDGTISNSYATGNVKGADKIAVGGLVGSNLYGGIDNSYAKGNVEGGTHVGGLVGYYYEAAITNSYATGSVTGTSMNIGGLVGNSDGGVIITNSYATGNVIGKERVGGLVGRNFYSTIENAYATGSVTESGGTSINIGGLVGYNEYGTIKYAYAMGDVIGDVNIGGLVGYNVFGTIKYTYATGGVAGLEDVGGLVGEMYNGTISNSYVKNSRSPCGNGSCGDVEALPEDDMKIKDNYNKWDNFDDSWAIVNGESTPYLKQVTLKSLAISNIDVVAGTTAENFPLPENAETRAGHLETTVNVDVDWEAADYHPTKLGIQWVKIAPKPKGDYAEYTIVGPKAFIAWVNVKPLAAPTIVEVNPGDGKVTLTWRAIDEADSYTVYQQVTTANGKEWEVVESRITSTTYTIEGLTGGKTYTFAVTAWNGQWQSEYSETVDVVPLASSSGDDSATDDSATDDSATDDSVTDDSATDDDDRVQPSFGTGYFIRIEKTVNPQTGKVTATIVLDEKRLLSLAQMQRGTTVPIIVTDESDKYNIPLSGVLVQAMSNGQLVLDIQTPVGNYTLPMSALNLAQLAAQWGADSGRTGVLFQVSIGNSDAAAVALMEAAAAQGGYNIVVPPVDFVITATYNGQTVVVSQFNTYIQREIPIPAVVDPNSVATAVAMDEAGNTHHVPTTIVERNGRYYAVIHSLTNSAYALIRNSKTFADMHGHWAQGVVEDLASRLIVNGVDVQRFAPDQPITREQFAELLIRTLGVSKYVQLQQAPFRDVPVGAWYAGAVAQSKQYGLIVGYQDGTFRPGKSISRFEAFIMLSRAMKLAGLPAELPASEAAATLARFTDGNDVASWARPAIAAAVQSGLVHGSGGKLLPNKTITRAETAAILHRLLVKAGLIREY